MPPFQVMVKEVVWMWTELKRSCMVFLFALQDSMLGRESIQIPWNVSREELQ